MDMTDKVVTIGCVILFGSICLSLLLKYVIIPKVSAHFESNQPLLSEGSRHNNLELGRGH
jgi:hypothetical protein